MATSIKIPLLILKNVFTFMTASAKRPPDKLQLFPGLIHHKDITKYQDNTRQNKLQNSEA